MEDSKMPALAERWSNQFGLEGAALKGAANRYRWGQEVARRWDARRVSRAQRNSLEVQAWKRLEVQAC